MLLCPMYSREIPKSGCPRKEEARRSAPRFKSFCHKGWNRADALVILSISKSINNIWVLTN
jgi:hypothetical protein